MPGVKHIGGCNCCGEPDTGTIETDCCEDLVPETLTLTDADLGETTLQYDSGQNIWVGCIEITTTVGGEADLNNTCNQTRKSGTTSVVYNLDCGLGGSNEWRLIVSVRPCQADALSYPMEKDCSNLLVSGNVHSGNPSPSQCDPLDLTFSFVTDDHPNQFPDLVDRYRLIFGDTIDITITE